MTIFQSNSKIVLQNIFPVEHFLSIVKQGFLETNTCEKIANFICVCNSTITRLILSDFVRRLRVSRS